MSIEKLNMTVGRFQPFTQGHLNMVNEGDGKCIIYQIKPADMPKDLASFKISGRKVKKENIQHVLDYVDAGCRGDLTDIEKEILKRPFTNELIAKELDELKRKNANILDVVYVTNMFQGLAMFNKFCLDNKDKYEPQYLMCGDDRVDDYSSKIDQYDALEIERGGEKYPSIIKGKLKTNIGKGRTEGVSGTAVRECLILKDKNRYDKVMPKEARDMFGIFCDAFDEFISKLRGMVNERKSLVDYIREDLSAGSKPIYEGGAAGHMAHVIDWTDMSWKDLKDLVDDLFGGKVETIKEKLDGMNIFATMNDAGETVFIRNNGNLNSERGGMTIDDMVEKWAEKEHQKKVFTQSGNIITTIFNKLGKDYFNPDDTHRKVINCECIIAGKTNIMPYATDRVAFHGYKMYRKENGKWIEEDNVEGHVDDIYDVAKDIDAAKPRPNLVIKNVARANELAMGFRNDIDKLFSNEGFSDENTTIEEYKIHRFNNLKPSWIDDDTESKIYERWFNGDKSYKASEMKKDYPDHYEELKDDKFAKVYIQKVMTPLDDLFLKIGNELIDQLDGFTNQKSHSDIVVTLKKDMEETLDAIKKSGLAEVQDKMEYNLDRLKQLGDKINSAEGVVFTYKGKLMKLTGSFAPINQLIGLRFKLEK